ncbi:hypothetical protein AB832_05390 [Flavobacteriaceae bacterium (ex Bugula neritina AB1)]|nr:hypothetical protein AB832_05390 [Flavobacteriaceae bacterium (ex Bugula neritina AB1)]
MTNLEKEIEAYLTGEMTLEEQQLFEKKIAANPDIRKELELYQEMHTIFDDTNWELTDTASQHPKVKSYETFLKSQKGKVIADAIQNAEEGYLKQHPGNRIRQFIVYVGSIAAIFIIGAFMFLQLHKNIDAKDLYAKHKNWQELPSLTLRDAHTDLSEAEKLFKQQKYQDALAIFSKYQTENDTVLNPQVLLYIGVTQLELDRNEKAIESFKRLLHSSTLDASKADWYLALAYLKLEETEQAKKHLERLVKTLNGYKYATAIELLRVLE